MSKYVTLLLLLGSSFATTKLNISRLESIQDSVLREEAIIDSLISPLSGLDEKDIVNSIFKLDDSFEFFLYTRDDETEDGYLLSMNSKNFNKSNFKANRTTKIIVHGWTDSCGSSWVQNMRKNYLASDDYNIICVNWYPGSVNEYLISVQLSKKVGKQLASLVQFAQNELKISLGDVHILGHSLGAHIAGQAGSDLSGEVGRITGLDPAKPAFENRIVHDPNDYLEWSDAKFVDVIHTCAGTVGFAEPIGHVDFYPNGGMATQPGCSILLSQSCSHERSYQFMIESISSPKAFVAKNCNSWINFVLGKCKYNSCTAFMGEKVDYNARGVYYLETNPISPFGKG